MRNGLMRPAGVRHPDYLTAWTCNVNKLLEIVIADIYGLVFLRDRTYESRLLRRKGYAGCGIDTH